MTSTSFNADPTVGSEIGPGGRGLVDKLPEDLLAVLHYLAMVDQAALTEIVAFVGPRAVKDESYAKRITRRLVVPGIVQVSLGPAKLYSLATTGKRHAGAVLARMETIFAAFQREHAAREETLCRWLGRNRFSQDPARTLDTGPTCRDAFPVSKVDANPAYSLLKDIYSRLKTFFTSGTNGWTK